MRYLYYCNSTYQLLNILNLHWHRLNAGFESIEDYDGELIIQNSFEGADQIAKIIDEEKTFSKVYLVEKIFNKGLFHSIQTLSDLLFPSNYLFRKCKFNKSEIKNRFDVICAPKYSILIDQIWRLNMKAKLHLIEDGTGSYHYCILFEPRSNNYRRLRKFVRCNDFKNYEKLYLVNKKMYVGDNENRTVEIPKYDKKYLNRIKTIFKQFSEGYQEKKIYWLSQFLNNKEFNEMVAEVLECLTDYKNDVLFCQHPRTHMDNVHGFCETDGKQIWELQILNMDDISNKLFISIHSTACFTAKMLYDEEPYVLMFYRMGDRKVTYATDNFEEIVKRFAASYSDPGKVMIPENLDEFKQYLKIYIKQSKTQ